MNNNLPNEILSRIHIDLRTGCWLWTGTLTSGGYGKVTINKSTFYVHRFVADLSDRLNGGEGIPHGYWVDHDCHNQDPTCLPATCVHRRCCNPDHLVIRTPSENILASPRTVAGINSRKTSCKRGHAFTNENTYVKWSNGRYSRECRTCRREYMRELRATTKTTT